MLPHNYKKKIQYFFNLYKIHYQCLLLTPQRRTQYYDINFYSAELNHTIVGFISRMENIVRMKLIFFNYKYSSRHYDINAFYGENIQLSNSKR